MFYSQVPSFCSDADDIDCRLENLTKKNCLEYNYDYENGFAIGNYHYLVSTVYKIDLQNKIIPEEWCKLEKLILLIYSSSILEWLYNLILC
jgi:hypothetical protein